LAVAYIGLGANLGDARANVEWALAQLAALPATHLSARSSLYRTAPQDSSGDDYINAVARLDTTLDPHALLRALQALEARQGRERPYLNAPRTLDLDLLLVDDAVIATDTLTVPHPRMHLRAFVLAPLLEIAPDIAIPGIGLARPLLAGVADQPVEKL
jgi:2-amino-4-hydroxy-6-hydroxymethyldihydropteridine diphosphokinase